MLTGSSLGKSSNRRLMSMTTVQAILVIALVAAQLPSVAQPIPTPNSSAACSMIDDAKYADGLLKTLADIDLPTTINESLVVERTANTPGYCQVSGYVAPSEGFVLRMPSGNWNGKLVMLGCAGLCGTTEHIKGCIGPLRRGYACIVSDGGHRGDGAEWMRNNLQSQVDFAYRAAHLTALAGKAIVEWVYGKKPTWSYFMGCSGGGRQAMMEAQRFPGDFDGIVAGAPALATTGVYMTSLWNWRAFITPNGPLLRQSEIDLLHQAALQQCELDDVVKDGLIADPRACHFDPAQLLCKSGRNQACLSEKQLEAVQKLYRGPRTSAGYQIYPPSVLPGSERAWLKTFPTLGGFLADQYGLLRYPGGALPVKLSDFDFDRDHNRLGMARALWEAVNPDLRTFKAAGGKLLLYAGWNDVVEGPLRDIDYYETANRVMGGRAVTQDFFRLFVIPGMNHCTGGEGAFAVDYLSYIEAWVEKERAPDVLIGAHVPPFRNGYDGLSLEYPLNPALPVSFTRPVYPFPVLAKYRGNGDPNDAASFAPASP
jgi:Tannase and feruloyl esterase